jgi:hypothetical protein
MRQKLGRLNSKKVYVSNDETPDELSTYVILIMLINQAAWSLTEMSIRNLRGV